MTDEAPDHEPTPLGRDYVWEVLRGVAGRAVLVAGQAVAWWGEYYAQLGRFSFENGAAALYVSKDADFVPASLVPADLDPLVDDVASRLRGKPLRKFAFSDLVAAAVSFTDEHSEPRSVEFLKGLHGIASRDHILDRAVLFEASDDHPVLYVMHPVMLFESRVANVVDLEKYRDEKGLLQARVAGMAAREWVHDLLDEGWSEARKDVEALFTLATSPRGITARRSFHIDVLGAVPIDHVAIPKAVRTTRFARCAAKIEAALSEGRAS